MEKAFVPEAKEEPTEAPKTERGNIQYVNPDGTVSFYKNTEELMKAREEANEQEK